MFSFELYSNLRSTSAVYIISSHLNPIAIQGEWRCPSCVAKEVSKIGLNYGFYDAHVKYNLFTFAEYANKFKTDYFNVNEPEVGSMQLS